ncbi:hypothetical protein TIFTF001_018866 [Ficus carica]|uniref:Uncharacterized protein n=1 Tax=Ficus carica TaxID=3494 RepID=A0AA88DJA9_FICCA|nr:hypothetical protein TIFTF001_018866 [Ficus carica]
MESSQIKSSVKPLFQDEYGKSSRGFKEAYKEDVFEDKSTGRLGYKKEKKYTRTAKYDDKEQGYTLEYESQLKFKHVAYPTSTTKNVKGGSSSGSNKSIDYY